MSVETPSVNQIFEKDRKKYIPEVGEQLIEANKEEIEINGEKLHVDYRVISFPDRERKDEAPVILLTGFGSGWEGIAELGFSLAAEGRKVILLSLPGYGNSDDPSKKYYETDNFSNEAEAVKKLIEKLSEEKDQKFHLIGHSMGSEILASLAEKNPELVASLVLLAPAGVKEKENLWSLGLRFGLDGVKSTLEYMVRMGFSGEKDYQEELKKYIPETKSPFAKNRLAQRMGEVRKLKKGQLLEKLKKIDSPIIYIAGKLDTVYPPNEQLKKIIEGVNAETKIEKSVMLGLRHNTTIAPDEITAANIEHYMGKAEKLAK